MKKLFSLIILSLSFYIISCSENGNPVKEQEKNYPVSSCTINGIAIDFVDTCSYNFVISFLSSFDSITIIGTQLGADFYIYADSGNYNYWAEYFRNDSTIQYLFIANSTSDSLILKFVLSGKKSVEEEIRRFDKINNLKIIRIEEQPKTVRVDVPENSESEWAEKFRKYYFVSQVYIVSVCCD